MSMMETVFQKQRKAFEKQVEEQNRGYRKPQKINIERNIQYGEDKLQTFDMIFPTDAKPDIPVIINIHGGGLVMGDKDFNTRFNIRMAQNGYLVISVNYRLVPEVTVFEQMQDVIDGIEAARKHQEEEREVLRAICGVTEDEINQINKRKSKRDYDWGVPVYLTADSAGAYLALYILAVQGSPEVAREFKVRPMTTRITAAAFISGMFYTTRKDKIGLFMPKYLYGRGYKKAGFYPYINPTNPEIIKSLPATLFVTSRSDMLHAYTVDVYEAAEKYGRYCTLIDYPKNKQLTHAFSVFYPSLSESVHLIDEICEFFNSNKIAYDDNYIGIIGFDSDVREYLPIDQFSLTQKTLYKGAVNSLDANGNTAMYNGLCVAMDRIYKKSQELGGNCTPIIFVLTDGDSNTGYKFSETKDIIAGMNIPIYTISYNYAADSLSELASINEAASIVGNSEDITYKLRNLFNAEM